MTHIVTTPQQLSSLTLTGQAQVLAVKAGAGDINHRQSLRQKLQPLQGADLSQQCWQAHLFTGARRKLFVKPSLLESRPMHCKNPDQSNKGQERGQGFMLFLLLVQEHK